MLFVRSSFIKDWGCDGFAIDCLEALTKHRIPFKIHAESFIEPNNVPERFKRYAQDKGYPGPNDFTLVINPACFLEHFDVDERTIVYTFWDANKIPNRYGDILERSRLIMVPSKETEKAIRPHIKYTPIEIVQPGFHPEFYDKKYHRSLSTTVFGAGGQITEQKNDRKNIESVVDCFLRAFPKDKFVELQLKIEHPDYFNLEVHDKRIRIVNHSVTRYDLSEWYNRIDCFVNLSKYESFGLMSLEAIACGTPVISPYHSGPKEYLKERGHIGYLKVGHSICSPSDFYFDNNWSAEWYQPNLDEVVSCMRWVQNEKGSCSIIAKNGMDYVHKKFKQSDFEERFVNVMRRFAF